MKFDNWVRFNPQAYDLVMRWLRNKPDVCRKILTSLLEITDKLDIDCCENGESLMLQLSTKKDDLELASFLYVLGHEEINQVELLKDLCNLLRHEKL